MRERCCYARGRAASLPRPGRAVTPRSRNSRGEWSGARRGGAMASASAIGPARAPPYPGRRGRATDCGSLQACESCVTAALPIPCHFLLFSLLSRGALPAASRSDAGRRLALRLGPQPGDPELARLASQTVHLEGSRASDRRFHRPCGRRGVAAASRWPPLAPWLVLGRFGPRAASSRVALAGGKSEEKGRWPHRAAPRFSRCLRWSAAVGGRAAGVGRHT